MPVPYRNIVAWQRADDLFVDVHRLTLQRLPAHERYELGSQLRRAAWSVPANIIEGHARGGGLDSRRFFKIARGSLNELGYGLHACMRLGYLPPAELEQFEERLRQTAAPLQGLIKKHSVQPPMRSPDTPG